MVVPRRREPASDESPRIGDGQLLDEIVDRLVLEFQPRSIYLFGSRARGDAREDSDYDLLVLLDNPEAGSRAFQLKAHRAVRGVHWPVDAIVMSTDRFEWLSGAAASLPATVKREGRRVYGR